MKLLLQFPYALLAGLVAARALPPQRSTAGLDVQLISIGNTMVKAVITNTGSTDVRLLTDGTFLDPAPVHKFHVSSSGT
jgi:deuterolysin